MAQPVVSVETTHADMIHDAQLDYYGNRLATCSSDRSVKIYDVSVDGAQRLVYEIAAHEGPVWQVSWAHPAFGVLLATCSYDCKVTIHRETQPNPSTWVKLYEYAGHKSSVNSVAWAPHEFGLCLACASSDGTVSIHTHMADDNWDVKKLEVSPLGVNAVSWAPARSLGSQGEGGAPVKRLVTGACDNACRVWKCTAPRAEGEVPRWEQEEGIGLLQQHTGWVRDVAWAPCPGIPCNTIASCSDDCTVVIWTQDSVGEAWVPTLLKKFEAPVWSVSWSVTGNVLAVSCGDQDVTLWKEAPGRTWVQVSAVAEDGVIKEN